MSNNQPIQTLKRGPIHAAIWAHEGNETRYYKVTVEKRYFDEKSQEFRSTQSLGRDELPMVTSVLEEAYVAIFELQKADRTSESEQS